MKSPSLALLLAMITTGLRINADGAGATSPWADPQLPVRQGLILWLDGSVQNAARQARQLPTLADNDELDIWFDGSGGTRVFVDGDAGGTRDRASGAMRMDELTVGARRYSNDPKMAPFAQGFFQGEIAEVLLYDRVLAEREREDVQKYLSAKYNSLKAGAVDPT